MDLLTGTSDAANVERFRLVSGLCSDWRPIVWICRVSRVSDSARVGHVLTFSRATIDRLRNLCIFIRKKIWDFVGFSVDLKWNCVGSLGKRLAASAWRPFHWLPIVKSLEIDWEFAFVAAVTGRRRATIFGHLVAGAHLQQTGTAAAASQLSPINGQMNRKGPVGSSTCLAKEFAARRASFGASGAPVRPPLPLRSALRRPSLRNSIFSLERGIVTCLVSFWSPFSTLHTHQVSQPQLEWSSCYKLKWRGTLLLFLELKEQLIMKNSISSTERWIVSYLVSFWSSSSLLFEADIFKSQLESCGISSRVQVPTLPLR